jgi:shikimate kinase
VTRASTVWLVGMMGAGKSTVGRALARRLGRRFVDADAEIERAAGRRIPDIFAQEGESGFRARERAAVEALAASGAVVALGGGAVAQPALRERLLASGVVVYLRAAPETLLARIGDTDERPLLAGLGAAERGARLRELLAQREAAYACAPLAVDTDGLSADDVAERIARALSDGVAGAAQGGAA